MLVVNDLYRIPAYVISNENQRWATSAIPNFKSVLTVTGSGDQALFYKLSGAEIVDTFDISPNAGVIQDIKYVTITHTQTVADYKKLLCQLYNTPNIMTIPQMHNIERFLTNASRKTIQHNNGCCQFHAGLDPICYSDNIPTHSEYNTLKNLLNAPFKFIQTDLETLSEKISGKYDLINLSNIFDYCYNAQTQSKILFDLAGHLNIGGHIIYLPQMPRFNYKNVQIKHENVELVYKDTIRKNRDDVIIVFQRTR